MTRPARRGACLAVGLLLAAAFGTPALATTIETVTSPGGITAWLVEDHSLPVVTLDVAFRGGAVLDPAGKAGLATLTTDLLDEGAGPLDSTAYQGREEDLATAIRFMAGEDMMGVSLRTTTANLAPAGDLLRLALTVPRFDAPAVARVRGQLLAQLASAQQQPRYIAGRLWRRQIFGDDPYGRAIAGTPATIAGLTPADMRGFVRDHFAKDAMLIGVVGDIAPAALGTLLDRAFGTLPTHAVEGQAAAAVLHEGGLEVARLPIPQSVVTFGEPGIKRDDPDWYAALLDNYILGGGGFDSRLTQEVREKRGLAYSIFTGLEPRRRAALIEGGVATENASVAQAIALIRREWQRLHDDGPTAAELAAAKTYLTGSFPLTLDSTGAMAAALVTLQRENLGIDYLDRRSGLIDGVTLEDAKRVARRLFDPAVLSFVVVGAPVGLEGAREVTVAGGPVAVPLTGQAPPPAARRGAALPGLAQ